MSSSPPPLPLPSIKPPGKPPLPSHYRVRSVSSGDYSAFSKQQQQQPHAQRQQQHHTSYSASASDLTERAELGLLSHLESRRAHHKTASGDVWCAAVQGERPPLAAVSHAAGRTLERNASNATANSSQHSQGSNGGNGSATTSSTPQHWRDLARRVVEMNRTTTTTSTTSSSSSSTADGSNASAKHKRGASRAHVFLGMIQEDAAQEEAAQDEAGVAAATTTLTTTAVSDNCNTNSENSTSTQQQQYQSSTTGGLFETVGGDAHLEQGDSLFSVEGTNTDRLFAGASVVNDLFETISESTEEHAATEATTSNDDNNDKLRHENSDTTSETVPLMRPDPNDASYGSRSSLSMSTNNNKRLARKKKGTQWQKLCERLAVLFHPVRVGQTLLRTLEQAYFLWAAIPIFFISWILVFSLDNPCFSFLPGNASSLAWWVNLMGRLCLTLEMARLVQWLWIDHVILGTRFAARCLGPLLTLVTIQGRGWPFVVTTWSMINLFLLHGTHKFQKDWFLFITFGFDSSEGDNYFNILESGEYVRCWVALIVAGLVTSAKRTVVAMYFGRRTFTEFKPKLEKLLKEVVLVSEVSELALEIERNIDHDLGDTLEVELTGDDRKVNFLGDMSWGSDPRLRNRTRNDSQLESDDESETTELTDRERVVDGKHEARPSGRERLDSSKPIPFKDLLDYWEEPVNKMDRSMNASIQDILKFRRALTFMDEPYPFGEAFGPAKTRDQVLESAAKTYQRLLASSEQLVLNCDVLYLLAEDEDGSTVDRSKKRNIRKLFHPDASNHVSSLSFVQACDSLYRRMRYFRASVGNASVIDHALESIVDGFYNFILCLVMLSILQINPWPLLVSISTLLVSISFAVGPSAAKYIEGILLIAIRRPFDLGDRIYMHEPSVWDSNNGLDCSWFVEDINLFNTTIRYAGTNEVATVSNGSIAHMRIVNGNRSPNAMVWFQLPFNLSVLEEEKLSSLRAFLDGYAKLHPHKWHSCAYCRADNFYPDIEKVMITIGFQARSSWQDLSGIYTIKSELATAVIEYGRRQGINYEELPQRQFHYKAGTLQRGGVWKNRADLHTAGNIISEGEEPPTTPGFQEAATPVTGSNLSRNEMPLNGYDGGGSDLSPNALFLSRLQESY